MACVTHYSMGHLSLKGLESNVAHTQPISVLTTQA